MDIGPKSGQTLGIPQKTFGKFAWRQSGMHQMLTPKRGSEIKPRTRDDQRQFRRQMPKLPPSVLGTIGSAQQDSCFRARQQRLDLIKAHDNVPGPPRQPQPFVKTSGKQGFDAVGQTIQNSHRSFGRSTERSRLNRLVYHIPASTQPHTAPWKTLLDIGQHISRRIDDESDHTAPISNLTGQQTAAGPRIGGCSLILGLIGGRAGGLRFFWGVDEQGVVQGVFCQPDYPSSEPDINMPAWLTQSSRSMRPLKLR